MSGTRLRAFSTNLKYISTSQLPSQRETFTIPRCIITVHPSVSGCLASDQTPGSLQQADYLPRDRHPAIVAENKYNATKMETII